MTADASDLGPMPEPKIEPGEPNPGGADAIEENGAPLAVPDLGSDQNPAVEDAAPEEIRGLEDTETEATSDGASDPQDESPA